MSVCEPQTRSHTYQGVPRSPQRIHITGTAVNDGTKVRVTDIKNNNEIRLLGDTTLNEGARYVSGEINNIQTTANWDGSATAEINTHGMFDTKALMNLKNQEQPTVVPYKNTPPGLTPKIGLWKTGEDEQCLTINWSLSQIDWAKGILGNLVAGGHDSDQNEEQTQKERLMATGVAAKEGNIETASGVKTIWGRIDTTQKQIVSNMANTLANLIDTLRELGLEQLEEVSAKRPSKEIAQKIKSAISLIDTRMQGVTEQFNTFQNHAIRVYNAKIHQTILETELQHWGHHTGEAKNTGDSLEVLYDKIGRFIDLFLGRAITWLQGLLRVYEQKKEEERIEEIYNGILTAITVASAALSFGTSAVALVKAARAAYKAIKQTRSLRKVAASVKLEEIELEEVTGPVSSTLNQKMKQTRGWEKLAEKAKGEQTDMIKDLSLSVATHTGAWLGAGNAARHVTKTYITKPGTPVAVGQLNDQLNRAKADNESIGATSGGPDTPNDWQPRPFSELSKKWDEFYQLAVDTRWGLITTKEGSVVENPNNVETQYHEKTREGLDKWSDKDDCIWYWNYHEKRDALIQKAKEEQNKSSNYLWYVEEEVNEHPDTNTFSLKLKRVEFGLTATNKTPTGFKQFRSTHKVHYNEDMKLPWKTFNESNSDKPWIPLAYFIAYTNKESCNRLS
ncbi:hypothetical protein [Spartinivicinus poritis]|uniref:Uncharacterized protein n=1 Tax=Spartinivicinus poritis TaxID=2994640 RepID=A0ABT5UHI3_9GAMM|nr:hypothetical protein [Spartinivicinus sp. A2-2]MDE1465862.1 hypothetical protein [Spartinivicinus sp. A2-2]